MTPSAAARAQRGAWADGPEPHPIRVAVVDDHEMVRDSIRVLLGGEHDMEWVGEARDGAGAADLVARTHPDVVLMDLSMPGTDGLTATEHIVDSASSSRVLVLTSSADPAVVRLSLGAGAAAVVTKDGNPATVLAGIRAVASGDGSPGASSGG